MRTIRGLPGLLSEVILGPYYTQQQLFFGKGCFSLNPVYQPFFGYKYKQLRHFFGACHSGKFWGF